MTDKRVEAQQVIRETEPGDVSDGGGHETRTSTTENVASSQGVQIDEKVLLRELKEELSTICEMYREIRGAKDGEPVDHDEPFYENTLKLALEVVKSQPNSGNINEIFHSITRMMLISFAVDFNRMIVNIGSFDDWLNNTCSRIISTAADDMFAESDRKGVDI